MCSAAIGHDLLEHLAAFLARKLVALVRVAVLAARFRKPELLRMLFENWSPARVPSDLPARRAAARRQRASIEHGGADVAEDEVAVAVAAKFRWAERDLGVDHQHGAGRAGRAPH